MSMFEASAHLYCDDMDIRFYSGINRPPDGSGVMIGVEGIEGWLSTPPVKTAVTERAWGDGAHDVVDQDVNYSARTVTIHLDLIGTERSTLIGLASQLNRMIGRIVRFRMIDQGQDTYAEGYLESEYGSNWSRQLLTGTLTLICPRPERLAWEGVDLLLYPSGSMQGGLSYGPGWDGLGYPLDYGLSAGGRQCAALLRNAGSSAAYPVVTVTGPMPQGVLLVGSDGRALQWQGEIGMVPLILDCRTQTASMGGVDVSRRLTRRGFPVVPPGGSLTLQVMSPGDGWVTVSVRDTYI